MDKIKTSDMSLAEPEIKFSRELGLLEATTLGVGAMIGAGIFILSGMAAGIAGPAATISYVLCGLMTLFTALSYSELSSSIPLAGGGYTFVHQGLGGYIAFLNGWALIFGSVVACSLYALGFAEHFNPLLDLLIKVSPHVKFSAFAIAFLLIAINIKGAKESGKTQNLFTISKVAILIIFIALCIPHVKTSGLKPFAPFGFTGIISATALIYISFFGFELISSASEEIKNPTKTVPRAILLSLFIPMLIYVGVVLVSTGILDYQALGTSAAPLVLIAKKVLGNYGLLFILIGGLLSTTSALNATILAASRQTYAMGRDGYLPGKIFRLHPRIQNALYRGFRGGHNSPDILPFRRGGVRGAFGQLLLPVRPHSGESVGYHAAQKGTPAEASIQTPLASGHPASGHSLQPGDPGFHELPNLPVGSGLAGIGKFGLSGLFQRAEGDRGETPAFKRDFAPAGDERI